MVYCAIEHLMYVQICMDYGIIKCAIMTWYQPYSLIIGLILFILDSNLIYYSALYFRKMLCNLYLLGVNCRQLYICLGL